MQVLDVAGRNAVGSKRFCRSRSSASCACVCVCMRVKCRQEAVAVRFALPCVLLDRQQLEHVVVDPPVCVCLSVCLPVLFPALPLDPVVVDKDNKQFCFLRFALLSAHLLSVQLTHSCSSRAVPRYPPSSSSSSRLRTQLPLTEELLQWQ